MYNTGCTPAHIRKWLLSHPGETREAGALSTLCGPTWGKGRREATTQHKLQQNEGKVKMQARS